MVICKPRKVMKYPIKKCKPLPEQIKNRRKKKQHQKWSAAAFFDLWVPAWPSSLVFGTTFSGFWRGLLYISDATFFCISRAVAPRCVPRHGRTDGGEWYQWRTRRLGWGLKTKRCSVVHAETTRDFWSLSEDFSGIQLIGQFRTLGQFQIFAKKFLKIRFRPY